MLPQFVLQTLSMNDWPLLILLITALLNALGAVLAWSAKLRWSREYAAAKDATISAKETQVEMLNSQLQQLSIAKDEIIRAKEVQCESLRHQIDGLRELTPMKVREYFISVKAQLEEYNAKLKSDLDEAQSMNQVLQQQLEQDKQNTSEAQQRFVQEAKEMEKRINELQTQYSRNQSAIEELEESRGLEQFFNGFLDGSEMCQILVDLQQGYVLGETLYEDRYCELYDGSDGSKQNPPERRIAKALELTGYLKKATAKHDELSHAYELTNKARRFLDLRQNKVPYVGEQCWTVIHKHNSASEAHFYLGPTEPDPLQVIGDKWQEGDQHEVNGPLDADQIYLKYLLLEPDMGSVRRRSA